MKIEDKLVDSSRLLIDIVTAEVGNDKSKFKEIIDIVFMEKHQISPRATRVLFFCTEKYPHRIEPYLSVITQKLSSIKNESVLNNLLKILSLNILPKGDTDLGVLTNYCFDNLIKQGLSVSMYVYSMDILYHISNLEPDLKNELLAVIEEKLPYGTAGFKSRGKKLVKKLRIEC